MWLQDPKVMKFLQCTGMMGQAPTEEKEAEKTYEAPKNKEKTP